MTPILMVGEVRPCAHPWDARTLSAEQCTKLGGPPLVGACTELAGHQSPHALQVHDVVGLAPVTRVYKWIEVYIQGRVFVCGGWSRHVVARTPTQS